MGNGKYIPKHVEAFGVLEYLLAWSEGVGMRLVVLSGMENPAAVPAVKEEATATATALNVRLHLLSSVGQLDLKSALNSPPSVCICPSTATRRGRQPCPLVMSRVTQLCPDLCPLLLTFDMSRRSRPNEAPLGSGESLDCQTLTDAHQTRSLLKSETPGSARST